MSALRMIGIFTNCYRNYYGQTLRKKMILVLPLSQNRNLE